MFETAQNSEYDQYLRSALNYPNMSVAKIVELVGSSNKSWEDAAQVAVNEAIKTIHGIRGIEELQI